MLSLNPQWSLTYAHFFTALPLALCLVAGTVWAQPKRKPSFRHFSWTILRGPGMPLRLRTGERILAKWGDRYGT